MPPRNPYKQLQDAIRAVHGCESLHVASKPVREVFRGELAWEGVVEEFALIDHPRAATCFAWSYRGGDKLQTVTVLALPPVDSPETAVKAAIAAEALGA